MFHNGKKKGFYCLRLDLTEFNIRIIFQFFYTYKIILQIAEFPLAFAFQNF